MDSGRSGETGAMPLGEHLERVDGTLACRTPNVG